MSGVIFLSKLKSWCLALWGLGRDCLRFTMSLLFDHRPKMYLPNVSVIILAGTLGCIWFWFYSEWFETVVALLSFEGVFAFFAFAAKFVSEQRLGKYQEGLEKFVLERAVTVVLIGIALVAGIAIAGGYGTIRLESIQDSSEREVHVFKLNSEPGEALRLVQGTTINVVRKTRWWSWKKPAQYCVKVRGYPLRLEEVRPFERERLQVPSSFRRPVVLLRAVPRFALELEDRPHPLIVTINRTNGVGKPIESRVPAYHGEALWIGCDDAVEVPEELQAKWLEELKATGLQSSQHHYLQLPPRSVLQIADEIHEGDSVHLKVVDENESKILAEEMIEIRQANMIRRFITEVYLHD